MAFYLLPYQTYVDNYKSVVFKQVILSLDGTMCIIETDVEVTGYTKKFGISDEVRYWWFGDNTEEWRNWMTEEDMGIE